MQSTNWTNGEIANDLRYVVCKLHIAADSESVWRVITDYERVTQVFSNMKKLKIVKDSGHIKVMDQRVQPLPPVPQISYTVEVKETFPALLEWRGMTSYIKVNQGCFILQPENEGKHTLVTFAVWAEAALIVPVSIIRYQLQKIMPQVLQTLKSHAEKTQTLRHNPQPVRERTG